MAAMSPPTSPGDRPTVRTRKTTRIDWYPISARLDAAAKSVRVRSHRSRAISRSPSATSRASARGGRSARGTRGSRKPMPVRQARETRKVAALTNIPLTAPATWAIRPAEPWPHDLRRGRAAVQFGVALGLVLGDQETGEIRAVGGLEEHRGRTRQQGDGQQQSDAQQAAPGGHRDSREQHQRNRGRGQHDRPSAPPVHPGPHRKADDQPRGPARGGQQTDLEGVRVQGGDRDQWHRHSGDGRTVLSGGLTAPQQPEVTVAPQQATGGSEGHGGQAPRSGRRAAVWRSSACRAGLSLFLRHTRLSSTRSGVVSSTALKTIFG